MAFRILHYADLEDTFDDPGRIGKVAGLINTLRGEKTVVVGAGDNIAPSGLALLTDGRQAVEFFNIVDADIDTLGNHDFDYGRETLLSVVSESPQCWLCANAYEDEELFGQEAGIVPWTVIERDGQRLGLFGLAHPNTDTSSPGGEGLSFTDPIPAATKAVETLREQDVEHILCVSHLGKSWGRSFSDDNDLARAVNIDVVLGGHEHGEPRIDRISETLLVRTSGEGVDISELNYNGEWSATIHSVDNTTCDPSVKQRFTSLHDRVGLNEVVATVDKPIIQSTETRYQGESRLGNIIADAYRWVSDADIGVQHGAGIRGTSLHNDVAVADLVRLVPFDKAVVRTEVSGTALLDILASGGELIYPTHPTYWNLHLSGGTVTFDYGDRELVSATVGDSPIDPSATYSVAAPENLFHSLGVSLVSESSEFGRQYEVLVDYARQEGLSPELNGRIIRQGI